MTTPWSVPRDWVGETVAVLAGGPSMSRDVAASVFGVCRVIAINVQGIDHVNADGEFIPAIAPWADMLYASDVKWWEAHRVNALAFVGDKVTIRTSLQYPEVKSLMQSSEIAYDPRPTHLVSGGNSGYQAVHIAAQRGAKRILLCGFDMRDVNGRRHWFGNYAGRLNTAPNYRNWIDRFQSLFAALKCIGVEVINCTPGSALVGCKRMSIEEAIR